MNNNFRVVLLLNRGHLIPNEVERKKIQKTVLENLQQIFPHEVLSYIVSLKGPDEQRLTNLIFTQIIQKASDFEKQSHEEPLEPKLTINEQHRVQIQSLLKKKMTELGFSGVYLLSRDNKILFAFGKSKGWQEKLGPQIIRMFSQDEAFDIAPEVKTNILRIEDFIMVTQSINPELKLILIGRESTFRLNSETYGNIEKICENLSKDVLSRLN